jgi:cytochrome c oxidase cbb3-type subunit III
MMRRRAAFALLAASGIAAVIVIALGTRSGFAQSGPPQAVAPPVPQIQSTHSLGNDFNNQRRVQDYSSDSAEALLHTPVSKLSPGGSSQAPQVQNPVAGDPGAAQRGMKYFESFNCVGCHAPNGGGGMGPALSNRVFIYG